MSVEKKRRALVTGASSGIGKATALAVAQAGINLALVSRSQEKLEKVALAANDMGVDAQIFCIDLQEVEQVKAKIQAIADQLNDIDILINNAGMGYTSNLSETSLADWQQVINVNLTSAFQCIQGILPLMRQKQRGTIINVASIAAKQTFPGWGLYCVSKFGLLALSQTLAQEERANGIRVTSLCPGSVNTEIWDTPTVHANFDRSQMLTPEMVAETIIHTVLLPQHAVIEEITIMSNAGVL